MTRRLILAILGTAIAALVLAGAGTFALTLRAERQTNERELRQQVTDLATLATESDDQAFQKFLTNAAVRRMMQVTDGSVARVDGQGRLVGPLPAGVSPTAITSHSLEVGSTFSGRRGRTVYAATVVQGIGRTRLVVVVTRRVSAGALDIVRWNLLSSAIVIGLGALVATTLGRRLTRPIRLADEAARRIAGGELSTRVPIPAGSSPDELTDLLGSVNHMAESLERSRAAEQQFLMSVSHDLRTPLTSIRGFAEAIGDGTATDHRAAAAIIANSGRRLERLVGDLLDLSKLRARSFSLRREPVDLASAARMVADGFDVDGLTIRVDASQPSQVLADRDRLDQVLANLIENATKHAATTVVIGVRSSGDQTWLWVDDDGPGIADTDMPFVFDRLYVSGAEPARRESGSGLGLAIVAELTEAMGGTVSAESSPLGGARLIVRLPAAPPT